ncbi:MAG: NOL1/NOP2/sun family putative RNA methylase, partial [Bacilli bacterium]
MEFKEHLKKYLNDEEISSLLDALANKKSKHALLLNEEKMNSATFEKEFPLVKKHPFIPNCYIYEDDIYHFGKHIYFDMGVYYLFEPCSPLVCYLLEPNENDVVLDIAASPGGKSTHASLMMKNKGILVSNEISKERSLILSSNIERMGRKNVIVTNTTASSLLKKYPSTFNSIILDAPCSGSGMFRKESKMKDDWTYAKVLSCAQVQKELILQAFDMLHEGGKLVYSTCSFSFEEDEEVVSYLLSQREDASLIEIPSSPYFYKSKTNIGIHLFPHLYEGEGHFICLIKKKESNNIKKSIKKDKNESITSISKICEIDDFVYKNDEVYYSLPSYFDTKGIHVIRGGCKLGTLEKYGFEFDHALSHAKSSFSSMCDLSLDETYKYLKGE